MSASLTFGSVGDIIAVCHLISDLITTLSESGGSVSEYQDLIRDLQYVQELLYLLDGLALACDRNPEYDTVGVTAKQKARDLRELVGPFYGKVKEYDKRLGKSGNSKMADAYWKLEWRVRHKESVARFRLELQGRRMAIVAILMTAHA
jgi:hypothetical protein